MKLAYVVPRYGVEVIGGAETGAPWPSTWLQTGDGTSRCSRPAPGRHHLGGRARSRNHRRQRRPGAPRAVEAGEIRGSTRCGAVCARTRHRHRPRHGAVDRPAGLRSLRCSTRLRPVTPMCWRFIPTSTTRRARPAPGRGRAVMHPAAHEEPALHLPVFDELFARCRGAVFQTRSERRLRLARFDVAATPQVLVGLCAGGDVRRGGAVRRAFGLQDSPYLICVGRVDEQKGTTMLSRFFRAYKERHRGHLRLVLVGQVVDQPEPDDDVVVTGMVDDATKWELLRGARPWCPRRPSRRSPSPSSRPSPPGCRCWSMPCVAPRTLRTLGRRSVVRRVRRVRGGRRAPDDGRSGARNDAPQRPPRTWRRITRGR